MSEQEKDFVYSESVKAGKRIYYFDVKQSRNGDKYIAITESKRIIEGDAEYPRFSFEKHKLFLYKEDFEKFSNALQAVIGVAQGDITPEEADLRASSRRNDDNENGGSENRGLSEKELKIDIDF